MREVNKIDLSSVVIKRTYAVSKNKLRYLSGIDILTEESSKNYDCYIILFGRYTNGERFKTESKISFKSYIDLRNNINNSIKQIKNEIKN